MNKFVLLLLAALLASACVQAVNTEVTEDLSEDGFWDLDSQQFSVGSDEDLSEFDDDSDSEDSETPPAEESEEREDEDDTVYQQRKQQLIDEAEASYGDDEDEDNGDDFALEDDETAGGNSTASSSANKGKKLTFAERMKLVHKKEVAKLNAIKKKALQAKKASKAASSVATSMLPKDHLLSAGARKAKKQAKAAQDKSAKQEKLKQKTAAAKAKLAKVLQDNLKKEKAKKAAKKAAAVKKNNKSSSSKKTKKTKKTTSTSAGWKKQHAAAVADRKKRSAITKAQYAAQAAKLDAAEQAASRLAASTIASRLKGNNDQQAATFTRVVMDRASLKTARDQATANNNDYSTCLANKSDLKDKLKRQQALLTAANVKASQVMTQFAAANTALTNARKDVNKWKAGIAKCDDELQKNHAFETYFQNTEDAYNAESDQETTLQWDLNHKLDGATGVNKTHIQNKIAQAKTFVLAADKGAQAAQDGAKPYAKKDSFWNDRRARNVDGLANAQSKLEDADAAYKEIASTYFQSHLDLADANTATMELRANLVQTSEQCDALKKQKKLLAKQVVKLQKDLTSLVE